MRCKKFLPHTLPLSDWLASWSHPRLLFAISTSSPGLLPKQNIWINVLCNVRHGGLSVICLVDDHAIVGLNSSNNSGQAVCIYDTCLCHQAVVFGTSPNWEINSRILRYTRSVPGPSDSSIASYRAYRKGISTSPKFHYWTWNLFLGLPLLSELTTYVYTYT